MKHFFKITVLIFFVSNLTAQDTLRLSLKEVEQRFFNKNLLLVANRTNIDIAKAYTEQAKLWDNPTILFENNFMDFQDRRFLDTKQQYLLIQQLFRLAQKRQKLTALQQENERLTEAQFNDLMRTLKHQLRSDYYELVSIYLKKDWYNTQIQAMSRLADAVNDQVKKGTMAEKEYIRLQLEVVQMQRELAELQRSEIPIYADLQLLTGEPNNSIIRPIDDLPLSIDTEKTAFEDLVSTASQNRTDLKMIDANAAVQQKNLVYQKSLAKPDLQMGLVYDRLNSYVPNYVGIQAAMNLPFFNKNQGNIKAAEIQIKQQQQFRDNSIVQIRSDIASRLNYVRQLQAWRQSKAAEFYKTMDNFYTNVLAAYEKHQITLVEFMDFFQSIQQNKLDIIEHERTLRQAIEDLRFVIGKDVF